MVRNTGASSPGGGGSARAGLGPYDEVGQRGGVRAGEPAGRLDGVVELVGHRRLERLDLVVADAGLPEPALVDEERVTRLPVLHLLRRSVALRVALVVAVPAVGRGLDDGGTAPGAGGQRPRPP